MSIAVDQKRRKYRNKIIIVDGVRFDSQKEAHRWGVLRMLQRNGLIRDLQRQLRIPLRGADGKPLRFVPSGRPAFYVADFAYHDVPKGVDVIEDVKGVQTPEFKLKRAILASQGVEIILT
uniref:DUF1064 domain-containing protein n=1 Tax=Paracoccus sp. TRP TaxID=412597 RepID=UPI000225F65E|nr:DUF1064 domain-containing protein [Paracoccus sp. TRP]